MAPHNRNVYLLLINQIILMSFKFQLLCVIKINSQKCLQEPLHIENGIQEPSYQPYSIKQFIRLFEYSRY